MFLSEKVIIGIFEVERNKVLKNVVQEIKNGNRGKNTGYDYEIIFVGMLYFKQFKLITLKFQIPQKQFLCMTCKNVVDHQEFLKL
jgi:hypothetical protein